jgi:hypothetical protein
MPTGAPKRTRSPWRNGIQGSLVRANPVGKRGHIRFSPAGASVGIYLFFPVVVRCCRCSYSRFVVAAPLTSLLLIHVRACLIPPGGGGGGPPPPPPPPPPPWTSRPKFEASNADCMKLGDGQVLIISVLTAFSRSEDFVIYVESSPSCHT